MEQPIKIDLGRHGIRSDESIKSDWVSLETEKRCHSVLKGKAQLLILHTQLFLFVAMINQSVQLTRPRTGQTRNHFRFPLEARVFSSATSRLHPAPNQLVL